VGQLGYCSALHVSPFVLGLGLMPSLFNEAASTVPSLDGGGLAVMAYSGSGCGTWRERFRFCLPWGELRIA